jgi:hypothetical protein
MVPPTRTALGGSELVLDAAYRPLVDLGVDYTCCEVARATARSGLDAWSGAMFDLKTSRDFYEKLLEDFADLQDSPNSARLAINCAITAYHMHEWVWGDWLKADYATWKELGIRDKNSFLAWIDDNEPWFELMQDICNGSKHFDRKANERTNASGGFDRDAFDQSAFDAQHLEIEVEVRGKKSWVLAEIVIESVVKFWRDFFQEPSPYKDNLPTSRAHFTDFK